MRLTVFYKLVDIQCNFNQQKKSNSNDKKQDYKDYENNREQYFYGKIHLENIPAQCNHFKLGNMLRFG